MLIEYYFMRHHEWSLVYLGHLPKEIFRILLYGPACVAKVDTHLKAQRITSGPRTKVGWYSEKNRAALDKYEELVKKHYPDPEVS